jgi:deoxyribonuclease IV
VYLGAHIGVADGLAEAAKTGRAIGCDAIQIFSKSPHSWKAPPIVPERAEEFRVEVVGQKLKAVGVHHNYLTNLGSPKDPMYHTSRTAFVDDLGRAELLGATHLIFHPGAHLGSGVAVGLRRITDALNWALGETQTAATRILLENAAGQGTTLGSNFDELAVVLDGVTDKERVGVAIDTCHLFASGRDFRTPEGYAAVKEDLRRSIGLKKVQAFHLNDSKAECGQHLDRHENIGRGFIGLEGFRHWLNDPSWAKVPGYLETPMDGEEYQAYVADLRTLRSLLPSKGT